MKGKLKSGFKYEINDKALASYEFLELLDEIDDKPQRLSRAFELLLGKEQKQALIESLKVDGFTPIDSMMGALQEIFENHKEIKN